jgi:O-antigen/teichoic acid export membrane protein
MSARPSIARVFSAGLVVSAATALVAILRAKVVAVWLGAPGLGLVAEVLQVVTLATLPATLVAGPALVRALAPLARDGADAAAVAEAQRAYDAAWTTALALGAVGVALAALWAPAAWGWGPGAAAWVAALGVSLVLAQGAAVVGRLLSTRGQVRAFSSGTLVSAALQAAGVALGVWVAGLPGFFVGSLVSALLALPAWGLLARRAGTPLRLWPRPVHSWPLLREAAQLGAATLAGSGATQLALLAIRGALSASGGATANGLFQACWSIDGVIVQAVTSTLFGFIFPRYAAAATLDELRAEVDGAVGFVLRFAPPALLAAIALRTPVLQLLYAPEFAPAASLLGWILAGDIAKLASWTQGGVLLYRGHARTFVALQLVQASLLAGLSVVAIRSDGWTGAGWAYAATYGINLALTGGAMAWATGVRPRFTAWLWAWTGLGLAVAANAAVAAFAHGWLVPLGLSVAWATGAGGPRAALAWIRARRAPRSAARDEGA